MTEVVIVGAGVIGCSIALELARRGAAPRVVDRHGDVGHGSTSASCGIVRRFYSTPTMTAMAHEGAAVWADWAAHLGLADSGDLARFERSGMLFVPPAITEAVRRIVAHMHELGVAVELLSPQEIARRFPFLETRSHTPVRSPQDDDFFEPTGRSVDGGVFEPDAGYVVSPQVATRNLRVACEREGVAFMLGRRVTAVEPGDAGGRFRLTLEDDASMFADVVVNAAGPHSAVVNRLAGVALQVETKPLRREIHVVENPKFSEALGSPVPVVGDVDSGVYFRPESAGRELVVGSLDPACDRLEWVEDPDDWNDGTTTAAHERQLLRMMKRFPDVCLGNRRGIAGLYDVTPLDWTPVLDRTDLPGYYVAIGTSGSSFKTAPVIGEVMAQLIDACEAGRDHDRDPLRLPLPRTGFELDVGFFSRLRGARRSSGTVLG